MPGRLTTLLPGSAGTGKPDLTQAGTRAGITLTSAALAPWLITERDHSAGQFVTDGEQIADSGRLRCRAIRRSPALRPSDSVRSPRTSLACQLTTAN